MPGLSLSWTLFLGLPALVLQSISVAFARALTTYSRSRLEEYCERRGLQAQAAAIERNDEWTERSAEALALLGSLILAALVGAHMVSPPEDSETKLTGLVILILSMLSQVVAGAAGRIWAEPLLARAWPLAAAIRVLAWPLTAVTVVAEFIAKKLAGLSDVPRPTSVEVEIEADAEHPEDIETELPESTRDMLERVVGLNRLHVREIMQPRASMVELSAELPAAEAARVFAESGYSRIPLFGVGRDDIVGILYAKDLFKAVVTEPGSTNVPLRKISRAPHFVPESKKVNDLLAEFLRDRVQIAIVVDEYGAVCGLVTFEDLIEEIVGPVDDEHDEPEQAPIIAINDCRYIVEASVPIEDLNQRFHLSLPTDDHYETLGGLAFHHLGRLPASGATFESDGVVFTIVEVADHSIRRLCMELPRSSTRMGA